MHAPLRYPFEPPTIVLVNKSLPAYMCQAVNRQLDLEARKLLGDPQVFELLNACEPILATVLKQPPPLAALKPAIKVAPKPAAAKKPAAKSRAAAPGGRPRNNRSRLTTDRKALMARHKRICETKKYREMRSRRNKLPASDFRKEVVDCVRENQVVIISGATGCGKTTQIPQFILEDCVATDATARCNMICTQPRRLSAIAVSERVAAERGERIGDTIGCVTNPHTKSRPLVPPPAGRPTACLPGAGAMWRSDAPPPPPGLFLSL